MKYEWTKQSYEWINNSEYDSSAPPGIVLPRSHCQSCKNSLKTWHNIPIVSYLYLRGRCGFCSEHISLRYPLIELLTAIVSAIVILQFGITAAGLAALLLSWALIVLAFIDLDHQLLPDDIVLPLLWLGLAMSLSPVFATMQDAIIGAIVGYLSFWIVNFIFELLLKKQGMGHGDFKLLALFGAWLGWQYLPQIVLISTLLGSVIGIAALLMARHKGEDLQQHRTMPFGPYIAIAGWLAMLWGDAINTAYLNMTGISS